jgi:septum formation protein
MDIILASNSPRRSQLLEEAGVAFRVVASQADEHLDDAALASPVDAAQQLAERKAGTVVQQVLADQADRADQAAQAGGTPQNQASQTVIVAADTMVVLDGRIFGKPHSASEAKGMLRKLSGNTHEVITGVSVWMIAVDAQGKVSMGHRTFADTSDVTFKQLTDQQIDDYLKLGESYDKAGAYAIQGAGHALVERYEGAFDNIVGLPVEHLLELFPDLRSRA